MKTTADSKATQIIVRVDGDVIREAEDRVFVRVFAELRQWARGKAIRYEGAVDTLREAGRKDPEGDLRAMLARKEIRLWLRGEYLFLTPAGMARYVPGVGA